MKRQKTKPLVVDESQANTQAEESTDQPMRLGVIDEHTDRREHDLARVKEALRIDDDDFCSGFLELLYDITGIYYHDGTYFNYALSILKDYTFINKKHVTLVLDDIRLQLAEKRISEKSSKPIQHDVSPNDLAWAQYYGKPVDTLPRRHITIDDQPALEFWLRSLCRLIQTRIELSEVIDQCEAAAELLNKTDSITLLERARPINRHPRQVANGKTRSVFDASKVLPETDPAAAKKSNGHAST